MPNRLRIGYPRDIRIWGEGGSFAVSGQNAGLQKNIPLVAAAGSYSYTGHAATLNYTSGGGAFLSWTAVPDATGYQVGWATVTSWPAYPNVVDVGNVTSISSGTLPGIGTGTRYLAVRAYYDTTALYDEWSAEITKTL